MRIILAMIGAALLQGCAYPTYPVMPPVMPATASASYRVLFAWNRADLSGEAYQIVRQAAAAAGNARIEVQGYTDTTGGEGYNQDLSIHRAQTVAAELMRNGVPQGAISIQGFGERRPLVPTGLDVREPLNRRVEIIIQQPPMAQYPPPAPYAPYPYAYAAPYPYAVGPTYGTSVIIGFGRGWGWGGGYRGGWGGGYRGGYWGGRGWHR